MRRFFLIFLLFFPTLASAYCGPDSATVVYINGIFTSLADAKYDLSELKNEYRDRTNDYETKFINGYNPSHLEGLGDLVQSAAQAYSSSINDFDLKTILLQIHPQVQTRKLLLIGHSQGAFYTNAMYDYLLSHGEPREAVGVYQVATPASYVAGGGNYLNNSNDKLLQLVAGLAAEWGAKPPLPFNITLTLDEEQAALPNGGHSFSDVYLLRTPNRVVWDVSQALSALKPALATEEGECFTAPEENLGYLFEKGVFAVADPAAAAAKTGALALNTLGALVGNTAFAAVEAAWGLIASAQEAQKDIVADAAETLTNEEHTRKNFSIVKTIYGSSLSSSDLEDLLGPNSAQGGAVALAVEEEPIVPMVLPPVPPEPTPPPAPEPPSSLGLGGVVVHEEPAQAPSASADSSSSAEADSTTNADPSTEAATTEPVIEPVVEDPPPPPFAPALPETGFYCDGDTALKVPGATAVQYRPTSSHCTFLGGFSTNQSWQVGGGVFKGAIGNATYEAQIPFFPNQKQFDGNGYIPLTADAGEQYFVAFWEYYNNVGGQYNTFLVPELISYLKTGQQTNGVPEVPGLTYVTMPFIYPAVE